MEPLGALFGGAAGLDADGSGGRRFFLLEGGVGGAFRCFFQLAAGRDGRVGGLGAGHLWCWRRWCWWVSGCGGSVDVIVNDGGLAMNVGEGGDEKGESRKFIGMLKLGKVLKWKTVELRKVV